MTRDEYQQIVLAEKDRVHTYAVWLLHDREEACDIAQEALVRLWQHHGRVDARAGRAWLLTTAHRLCVDLLRRRTRRAEMPLDVLLGDREDRARVTPDADHAVELRSAVAESLARLSPNGRAVVVLREMVGMSYEGIGNVLGQPVSTVKVTLHRARKRLRRELLKTVEKL